MSPELACPTARELLAQRRRLGSADAEFLLGSLLGLKRHELYEPERRIAPDRAAEFASLVRRADVGTPIEYVLGRARFMDFEVLVDERVLIPRSETEELVVRAVGRMQDRYACRIATLAGSLRLQDCCACPDWEAVRTASVGAGRSHRVELRVLDLGTGSGVIAIALARLLPEARVVAGDVSDRVLDLAGRNVAALGLKDRIELVKTDLFSALAGRRFDLIVANLPYVPTGIWETLEPAVRCCEPRLALDGGTDGMDFVRPVLEQAGDFLTSGGLLALELDPAIAGKVRALCPGAEIESDWQGNERFIFVRKGDGR